MTAPGLRELGPSALASLLVGALVAGAVAASGSIVLAGATGGMIAVGLLLVAFGIRGPILFGLGVLTLGLLVPVPIRALCEIGLVGAALWLTVDQLGRSTWMRAARVAFLAMVALYTVLLFHPNLPDLGLGIQGIRGTIVGISGLFLGLGLSAEGSGANDRKGMSLPDLLLWILAAAGAASLLVHVVAPGFENALPRAADSATSSLGGETRMQGLLPGPFHVSMLGALLASAGVWKLILRHVSGLPLLALGMALLLLARVRTGLLAWAVAILLLAGLLMVLRTRFPAVLRRLRPPGLKSLALGAVLIIGFAAFALAAEQNVAVQQLNGLSSDHRVADRRSSIDIAVDLAERSPIVGWGPGSASSGLGDEFASRGDTHVTPHNGALGLIVEAGLGALICFLVIAGSSIRQLWRQSLSRPDPPTDGLAIAASATLGVFWLFGDGLAATPVSLLAAMILGACLRQNEPSGLTQAARRR